MYDHELSVVMQRERERAIREARLHHRFAMVSGPSMRQRLMSVLRRPVAGRDAVTGEGAATRPAATSGTPAAACGTRHAASRSVPG